MASGFASAREADGAAALRLIKLAHTVVWAVFAGSIVAIPVLAWRSRYPAAGLLIAFVMIEVLILVANGWRCPLTAIAARYTDDRRDNFDIYLPLWMARYNKTIFGSLFAAGLLFTVIRVLGR
jgi:hypothetical protein